jgi:N-methylhydantoinase A
VLRVGPRSAGAEPGPACYGRGGAEPAVTDALVVLGLIDPYNFLGGRLPLADESAIAAVARLAHSVGLGAEEAAVGMYRLACEGMTLAVKGLLIERGLDPRRFAFVCYGGCGPLFAVSIARTLGIGKVFVPGLASVFSAYGAATADVRREAVRTVLRPLPVEPGALEGWFAALESEVTAAMQREGIPREQVTIAREADLRFRRQTWEVTVAVPAAGADLATAFRERYAVLYGRGALAASADIDLVNCRVTALARPPRPVEASLPLGPSNAGPARRANRQVWLPEGHGGRVQVAIYDGEQLAPGMAFAGPALVERRDTTILVGAHDRAQIDGAGSLLIEVSGAGGH